MAKALSQVYTAIRGSVGGVTYTANSYHSIIARARVAPTNPRTGAQQAWRSAFAAAVGDWRSFEPTVQAGWSEYAHTLSGSGPTGSYDIPGRQAFIGARSFVRRAEQTGLAVTGTDQAPAPGSGVYGDIFVSVTEAPGVITFTLDNFGTEDVLLYVQRSRGFSRSRNVFTGPYLPGQFIEISAESSDDVTFSGLEAARYWLKLSGVTMTNGNRLVIGRSTRKDLAEGPAPPP